MRASFGVLCLILASPAVQASFIINGDFSSGNTGFTSQYLYSAGDIGPAQSYDVVTNPANSRPNDINPVSYGDHTTGTGLMMAVNGATAPNQIVWSQSVSVLPNSHYDFELWISSWFPTAPAAIDVRFNGLLIGVANAPSNVAVWQRFTAAWQSGATTSLTITLTNTTLADIGGDFALDDIALHGPALTAIPEPSSFVAFVLAGAMAAAWRRKMASSNPSHCT